MTRMEKKMPMGPLGKCLACVGEGIQGIRKAEAKGWENVTMPEPEDAITLAPAWQQQAFMGQTMFACVAVPTCIRHLQVHEPSAIQRAPNGIIIPG